MMYAGLDLHKDFSVITMMNAQGKEVVREDKLPDNGGIDEFFQGFNELVTVAMEATRNLYQPYYLLEENGMKVKPSHALKAKSIASAKVKRDKTDCGIRAPIDS